MAGTRRDGTEEHPKVTMLLSLSNLALATTLVVPVKATYTEYTGWGEGPTVVDDVLSATVVASNATSGARFTTTGELLLKEKTGAGAGELKFGSDPSGSVRTWALYLLDANGVPISAEPQILDIAFGTSGDGSVAARASTDLMVRSVKVKKKSRVNGDDGTHTISVTVQASGTRAAYIGVQELASDGSALSAHVDMEAMTTDVYASFQGLALDAIVPLDTWNAQLAGTVKVAGVTVSGSTVESGANMTWEVAYGGAVCAPGSKQACPTYGTATYAEGPIQAKANPKPKAETTTLGEISALAALKLSPKDEVFDEYDATMDLVVEGDGRGLDVSASLTPVGTSTAPISGEVVTLSPSDLAITASATAEGQFPAKPEAQTVRTVGIQPLAEGEKPLAGWLECTLTPTAKSAVAGSTNLRWVGECLRGDEGEALVRGLSMTMDDTGAVTLSAEMLGTEWQDATALAFDVDGDDLGVGYTQGAASVSETTFSLDWGFPSDVDGQEYEAEIIFYGTETAIEFTLERGGWYEWEGGDPTWSFYKWPNLAAAGVAGVAVAPTRAGWRTLNVEEHKDNE